MFVLLCLLGKVNIFDHTLPFWNLFPWIWIHHNIYSQFSFQVPSIYLNIPCWNSLKFGLPYSFHCQLFNVDCVHSHNIRYMYLLKKKKNFLVSYTHTKCFLWVPDLKSNCLPYICIWMYVILTLSMFKWKPPSHQNLSLSLCSPFLSKSCHYPSYDRNRIYGTC